MVDIKFNYESHRSAKARISVGFSDVFVWLLVAAFILSISGGAYLLFFGSTIGWTLIGFSAVPAMIIEWRQGELRNLKLVPKPFTIDDILSVEVLGRLSIKPTPREVANIVGSVAGGQFFASRFGISARFLQEITSENSDDMRKVWQEAWGLRNQTGSSTISSAILVVALIESALNHKALLSHLQLDVDDLIQGVYWYNHLNDLIEKSEMPKKTGGIARDWSFGWTPLLDKYGRNISRQINLHGLSLIKLAAHDDALTRLIDVFSKDGRHNVALIGPTGTGKTQIVHALAAKLLDGSSGMPSNLQYHQVFMLDASSLIADAPNRGDLERIVPQILNEAYRAKNIIVCLDNAHLFFDDNIGSVDIMNIIRPILENGALSVILIMDDKQYQKICGRQPEIVNILNRINVDKSSEKETFAVMQDQSISIEFRGQVTFMYQALAEAYRLSDRYIHELAMPGKAIGLLESAVNYSENGLVTANSVRMAVEKTLNVKVGVVSEEGEREKLLNLENLIHERMINQVKAVNVVCDALRRARAGVKRHDRPIGTFLFLGPTGVGKTELAKALASVYFENDESLIRLDMNEFIKAEDIMRLIASEKEDQNSLISRVARQPFSVILLDEIEKAHPKVLAALLQMLDEGIMRDTENMEIGFSDTIVIATSNAGADRIREYINRGYDIDQFEPNIVDELIKTNVFLPEFLNRFDEIVVFKPLEKKELLQVVDLMIASINRTLSLQKISIKVSDAVKEYLVSSGYDPQFGARPMRRVIQRSVENMVAKKMLSGEAGPGSEIEIDIMEVKKLLEPSNDTIKFIGK